MLRRRVTSFGKKVADSGHHTHSSSSDLLKSSRGVTPDSEVAAKRTEGITACSRSGGVAQPESEDFDRLVEDSAAKQEKRRREIEAELALKHSVRGVRPFSIVAEGLFSQPLGMWLIKDLGLLPHDEWNVIYLPTEGRAAEVLNLPLHPGEPVGAIDRTVADRLMRFRVELEEVHREVGRHLGTQTAGPATDRYLTRKEEIRRQVLDYVARVRPLLVDLLFGIDRLSRC